MIKRIKNNNQIKNAFTLIELLGVLILLAVIALITFPIIDKVLSNAKNEAYERQKDSIIEAARMYVTTNGNYSTSTKQLSFQTLIDAGYLKEGEILDSRDSSKKMPGCVLYNWSESKNQYIFEYSEDCKITYAVGDLLKVQVSDSETQNIYVLEINGDEIVGILDRNLEDVADWISTDDYYAATGSYFYDDDDTTLNQNLYKFGPITANNVLNERTSSWNKVNKVEMPEVTMILKLTKFYQNLSEVDKQNWESKYVDIINKSYEVTRSCNSNADCRKKLIGAGYEDLLLPEWITMNLYTTGGFLWGYWTSTPVDMDAISSSGCAWNVNVGGFISINAVVDYVYNMGIRPVIHIYKSNILEKLEVPEYMGPVGGEFPSIE